MWQGFIGLCMEERIMFLYATMEHVQVKEQWPQGWAVLNAKEYFCFDRFKITLKYESSWPSCKMKIKAQTNIATV